MRTVEALSYIVKGADPDGVELYMTSRPNKFIHARSGVSSKILKSLERHTQSSATQNTNLEENFGLILDKTTHSESGVASSSRSLLGRPPKERQRPASIYVLTDGVWNGNNDAMITLIRQLVERAQMQEGNRPDIMVQFIQFGHDESGTERLKHLNEALEYR